MVGTETAPALAALVRTVRAALAWEVDEPAPPGTWPAAGPSLREVATRHRIAPLLAPWRHQLELRSADVAWLDDAQRANAAKALVTARRNIEIVDSLGAGGVRALTLKGLPLARRTSGNLAGRHCGDIDVLVATADLETADRLLRADGFALRAGPASSPFEEPHRRWVIAMDNHVTYWHEDGTHLELHWRLTRYDLIPLRFEQVWDARAAVDLGASTVPALGELHDRLFVLVHAAKHDFQRLQWAVDVVRLLRGLTEDTWAATVRAGHELGVATLLEACGRLTDRLAPIALPRVDDLSPPERARAARLVDAMWARCLNGDECTPGWIRQPLSLRAGVRYRSWVLARNAVPPFLLDTVGGSRFTRPVRLLGQKVLGRTKPPGPVH